MNQPVPAELPGTKPHMEGTMAPGAYTTEDDLVGHQSEERFLILRRLDAPV